MFRLGSVGLILISVSVHVILVSGELKYFIFYIV